MKTVENVMNFFSRIVILSFVYFAVIIKDSLKFILKYINRSNLILFFVLFSITFIYFYKTTYTYNNIELNGIQSSDNKVYVDIGYGIKEHFSLPVTNGKVVISGNFVNMDLIKNIYIKTKKGVEVIAFPQFLSKENSNKYIKYEFFLSALLSFLLIYLYRDLTKITKAINLYYMENFFEFSIIIYLCIINIGVFILLYPQLSQDSFIQFTVYSSPNNWFSYMYITLCIFSYILFGTPYLLINIIFIFSAVIMEFFIFKILKNSNIIMSTVFILLIAFFPFILFENTISERPGMSIIAVAALVISLHNFISHNGNKLLPLVILLNIIASASRCDLALYFVASIYLYIFDDKHKIRTLFVSMIIPIIILLIFFTFEKYTYGHISEFSEIRTANYKLSRISYIFRDKIVSKSDKELLEKYMNTEYLRRNWQENDYTAVVEATKGYKKDKEYHEVISRIYKRYIFLYPWSFIKSRIKSLFPYKRILFNYSSRSHNQRVINGINNNKIVRGEAGKMARFVSLYNNQIADFLVAQIKYFNYIKFILPILLIFCIFSRENKIPRKSTIPLLFSLTPPIGKMLSLFLFAPMAGGIYSFDVSIMILLVYPIVFLMMIKMMLRI